MTIAINIYLKKMKKPFYVEFENKDKYDKLLSDLSTPLITIVNISNVLVFSKQEFVYLERVK